MVRSDLAKRLDVPPSSLQRELANLAASGILLERREGNRAYFRANGECPFLPELKGLLVKTAGVFEVLREVLEPSRGQIRFAFVFGSMARGEERSESDVDLLIVGTLRRAALVDPLRRAEDQLGRPVNAKAYTVREFADKRAAGHHFVRQVTAGEKLFVIGTEEDLEEARQRSARSGARRNQE